MVPVKQTGDQAGVCQGLESSEAYGPVVGRLGGIVVATAVGRSECGPSIGYRNALSRSRRVSADGRRPFRPRAIRRQWASLRFAPVRRSPSAKERDRRPIAINEGHHDASLSPFSGREQADRAARRLGERGEPRCHSKHEFVKGHNDLVTDWGRVEKGALRPFRWRRRRERQRDRSYPRRRAEERPRAGAVGPSAAQGDLRSAEIAWRRAHV